MVDFEPDVGRNRLVIRFGGIVQPHHLVSVDARVQEALARLRPPIDVLSDIRELVAVDAALVDDFCRVARLIGRFGTRKVVRVVGKSAQGAVQLARLSRHLKGHEALLAYSLAEAEQVFSGR